MKRVKCYYVSQVIVNSDYSKSVYVIKEDIKLRSIRSFFAHCRSYVENLDSFYGLDGNPVSVKYNLYKEDINGEAILIDSVYRNFYVSSPL